VVSPDVFPDDPHRDVCRLPSDAPPSRSRALLSFTLFSPLFTLLAAAARVQAWSQPAFLRVFSFPICSCVRIFISCLLLVGSGTPNETQVILSRVALLADAI